MKSLTKFKQEPSVILEEEKSDYSKFDMLVRAGLANKAQIQRLHKILDKMQEERPVFNNADRQIMQNLFNKMVDLISNNKQIFQQTRRVVREDLDEGVVDTADVKISPSGKKVRAHRIVMASNTPEVKDVKEETEQINEDIRSVPPAVLVLKRKEIRMFSNDTRIALYYNDKINKYFTVPFSVDRNISSVIQAEQVEIKEPVINCLHKIVEEKVTDDVTFKNGQTQKVDLYTASAIMDVYNALNEENKEKIAEMIEKSSEDFQKIANFAFSKTK